MNALSTTHPSHDEIALHAFLLWEKEGRQPGREMTYWLAAEMQFRQTRLQQVEAASKATRPWPPPSVSPKPATARAIAPVAPKTPKLATASRPAAAAKSKPARKSSAPTAARKTLPRN